MFHRRRELVLLHEGHDPTPGSTAPHAGRRRSTASIITCGSTCTADFDRLARLITGHAVGVVMAGGGARAFTHIGVVKAMRASGVPIDLIGGTSMGAIVAAGVAARWTDEELVERFRRAFVDDNPLSDYTVPAISLFAGRRVDDLLRSAFGEKRHRGPDPAVLLRHRQPHDLDRRRPHASAGCGAGCAPRCRCPGVLPPFNDAGQVHVDGGVIDNFPVRAMRKLGRGVTIGVDIDTGGALAAGAGVEEPWSAWEFFRRLVWKRKETLPIPSIVRILLRSALVASTARAVEDRAAADLLIVPPMNHYRPARLDELRRRRRDRLPRHHGSARQGDVPPAPACSRTLVPRGANLDSLTPCWARGQGQHAEAKRNFRLFTTLSIVLRGPWTPMPTKSSASAGAAAKAARLSASLVVLNIASM